MRLFLSRDIDQTKGHIICYEAWNNSLELLYEVRPDYISSFECVIEEERALYNVNTSKQRKLGREGSDICILET